MELKRTYILSSLLIVLCALATGFVAVAQDRPANPVVELRSSNCETDEANFNVVRVDALKALNKGSVIIAIARLGSGDKRRGLNQQRLNAAKEWLAKAGFPIEKLTLAQGERVTGSGRLEFYVEGRLTHLILPRPNLGLCTECCNPRPEDFTQTKKRRQ